LFIYSPGLDCVTAALGRALVEPSVNAKGITIVRVLRGK
jgi:hypothetical protein